METERIIPGTPILFIEEKGALQPERMNMPDSPQYSPSAMSALNCLLRSVPGVLIVIVTSKVMKPGLMETIERDMRQSGFSGEVCDVISRFRGIGESPADTGPLIDKWLDDRFRPDDIVNFAVCSECASMFYANWVPVSGYYGLLAVQAQMAVNILTDDKK